MSPIMSSNPSIYDDVARRLEKLSIPGRPHSPSDAALDAAFSYTWPVKQQQQFYDVIDGFAPRRHAFDLSPTSSTCSSDQGSFLDAFVATRSRVIRMFNLPPPPASFLASIFRQNRTMPLPITMWSMRHDAPGRTERDNVWAVYQSHEEACTALRALSQTSMSVEPAVEADLEPFQKLRRFDLTNTISLAPPTVSLSSSASPTDHHQQPQQFLRMTSSVSDFRARAPGVPRTPPADYMISSNPPNPRTSFRLGDWIRNIACIGCGSVRVGHRTPSPNRHPVSVLQQSNRLPASPRFVPSPQSALFNHSPNAYSGFTHSPTSFAQQQQQHVHSPSPSLVATPTSPVHHLLTPSGRAFAVGGKVQNISTDPLSPCVMYWPDNEPLPEQGQIRPSLVMGVPAIGAPLSTSPVIGSASSATTSIGGAGRYAEGNGDSISAAVQAERIALLTSALNQVSPQPSVVPRSHSSTPPQRSAGGGYVDISPPQAVRPQQHQQQYFSQQQPQQQQRQQPQLPQVHRSQSQFELGAQYANCQPIYQTSAPRQNSLPMSSYSLLNGMGQQQQLGSGAPAPLLPSFLQDIVQSPTLSPASMSPSSAELSFDEYEYDFGVGVRTSKESVPRSTVDLSDSMAKLGLSSIWKLGGEETKGLSATAAAFQMPIGSRRGSREILRTSN
ncbi:hypothetical protein HWV62_39205 [Athelia sp. TMB]|nr:hypothetical protein HWV62_39205 [Athelia sp. TMB]